MKIIAFFLLSCLFASPLFPQGGKVIDNLTLKSEILKMERKYAIYLPPDYESSERTYPILYLLHGGGGDQTEWIQRGDVKNISDKAINEGISTAMIIVMPDASGQNRGFFNDPTGKWMYEDYFFEEFIPFIEKTYRVKPGRQFRAVGGLSMGGQGTLLYALHHPEVFRYACALSPATFLRTIDETKDMLQKRYPDATDVQIEDFYNKNSILKLVNDMPENQKSAVLWYIETGDDDPIEQIYIGNCELHIAMRKNEIPHEFRISDGAHTWALWRSALPSVLGFVSMNISR
jgi:enterochelin esterase-like enzyme